jgi:hypothetical protein
MIAVYVVSADIYYESCSREEERIDEDGSRGIE